jgi:hypothetical protein
MSDIFLTLSRMLFCGQYAFCSDPSCIIGSAMSESPIPTVKLSNRAEESQVGSPTVEDTPHREPAV